MYVPQIHANYKNKSIVINVEKFTAYLANAYIKLGVNNVAYFTAYLANAITILKQGRYDEITEWRG